MSKLHLGELGPELMNEVTLPEARFIEPHPSHSPVHNMIARGSIKQVFGEMGQYPLVGRDDENPMAQLPQAPNQDSGGDRQPVIA